MKQKFCLLFDLDGTLVNTDPLHFAAFQEFLGDHGKTIDINDFHQIIHGNPNAQIMQHYLPDMPDRHEDFADDKEARFRAKVRALEPTLGLGDLNWAEQNDCPFAVVTNAPRANAEMMVAALGFHERFDHLIIGEECEYSKPHPAPYLRGLESLGGDAAHAVAFEDSVTGIRAAVAAGIYTVGMRTTLPDSALRQAGASRIVDDFRDPELLEYLRNSL